MDWKYVHYDRQQTLAFQPDAVLTAARAQMSGLGWDVTPADGGFEARGASFGHAAIALFRVRESDGGALITVELRVERAGYLGFILIDVGGYYIGQVDAWLRAILAKLMGVTADSLDGGRHAHRMRLFNGFVAITALILLIGFVVDFFILPIFGLFTGTLYFFGRGGSSSPMLVGPWARAVSVGFLAFDAFLVYRFWFASRRPRTS